MRDIEYWEKKGFEFEAWFPNEYDLWLNRKTMQRLRRYVDGREMLTDPDTGKYVEAWKVLARHEEREEREKPMSDRRKCPEDGNDCNLKICKEHPVCHATGPTESPKPNRRIMIKRPLDPRFSDKVRDGRKTTTIRGKPWTTGKPWPTGKPIMLYNWSGKPYRSKHVDVAPVMVSGSWPIRITRNADDSMSYECGMESEKPIHETEGFESAAEMDDWFRPLVAPGRTVEKALMRFSLLNGPDEEG